MMVKILIDNGIDAYTYSFGFESTLYTHVIVLVKHGNQLLVFDPYIGYELLDEKGSNVDFISMIDKIKNDDFSPVYYSEEVITDFLLDFTLIDTIALNLAENCPEKNVERSFLKDEIYLSKQERSFSSNILNCSSFIKRFEKELHSRTNATFFYEGFLLKINEVYGAPDHREVDAMIDSLLAL